MAHTTEELLKFKEGFETQIKDLEAKVNAETLLSKSATERMYPVFIALSIILLVAAVFLVVAIIIQSNKSQKLSSTISGGSSDTYYGKNKSNSASKKLSIVTIIVTVFFIVAVSAMYILQTDVSESDSKIAELNSEIAVLEGYIDSVEEESSKLDSMAKEDAKKDDASKDDATKDEGKK
ncbi:MAG: preprotein translocase subunit SecG [Clostridia bacterium]|nr:preprotein translocase subunit SecG [Clostridia bacterium]